MDKHTGPTRREFLARSAGMSALLVAGDRSLAEKTLPDPLLVNHVGFARRAGKVCMAQGSRPLDFSVVHTDTGRTEYKGRLASRRGDFGDFLLANFTTVQTPGQYVVRIGNRRSAPFTIADDVYHQPLAKSVAYFSKQRCGDSKTGYNAPCHLDDGRRTDNGHHYDATGGWHDACDVRKWVNATVHGMLGLLRVLDDPPPSCDRSQLIEELRWGNQYFLKMQEPAGYLMDYCGGDKGNWYTDNQIGTDDDRPVETRVCELPAQFHFVTTQAGMIRHLRAADPQYANRCENAARKCFAWCTRGKRSHTATSLASAILACVELHRAFDDLVFSDLAAEFAAQLIELQVSSGPVKGFFLKAPGRPEPERQIMYGNLPLLALCALLEQFSGHRDVGPWRSALEMHAEYVTNMAARSAFGIVPFGLYTSDPGGNRAIGDYFYRWFMRAGRENPASPDWWVGINAHLASNGLGLCRASRLLDHPALAELAQRQLDWILGVNPFDASTVTAVGRNQPPLYVTNQFKPPTPHIPGGVMNGLGGDENDQPVLLPGSYHTCEYWTPMLAYTMAIMLEASKATS